MIFAATLVLLVLFLYARWQLRDYRLRGDTTRLPYFLAKETHKLLVVLFPISVAFCLVSTALAMGNTSDATIEQLLRLEQTVEFIRRWLNPLKLSPLAARGAWHPPRVVRHDIGNAPDRGSCAEAVRAIP
jgi:hypothetical protein